MVSEKTAVPFPPVGAGGEQPISQISTPIITDVNAEHKPRDKDFEEIYRQMQRLNDPAYLHTVSMNELYENVYQSRPPVIDGLLHAGTYLFVGAPKIGKSFLMAQLAYHVSTGQMLWNYPVHSGTVLYLALEDDYRRLQERLFRMFGTDGTENLYFAICAKQLGMGLDEQLQKFVREHPDTRLIIIDTLQKIREAAGEKYSYASDYEIVGRLKQLADRSGVCLLLVHHTRKQQAEDRFDMISGTNGLLGAADGAFLLQKERRTDNTATLDISGRDQQEQRLYLVRDAERLIWHLERAETEPWKEPLDPILDSVAGLVATDNTEWNGSPTDLANAIHLDMKPNTLTMRLNVNAARLLQEYGVRYENSRNHAGRNIKLARASSEA